MKIMLKDIKYIYTIKAVGHFMIIFPLVFSFFLVSCQSEECIQEQYSDKDIVPVILNLSTRSVDSGESEMLDMYSADPANCIKPEHFFPSLPLFRE